MARIGYSRATLSPTRLAIPERFRKVGEETIRRFGASLDRTLIQRYFSSSREGERERDCPLRILPVETIRETSKNCRATTIASPLSNSV